MCMAHEKMYFYSLALDTKKVTELYCKVSQISIKITTIKHVN